MKTKKLLKSSSYRLMVLSITALMATSSMAALSISSDSLQKKRAKANSGSVVDQTDLGRMYHLGDGYGRGDFESARWFRKAAKQGNTESQYALGAMSYSGHGVKLDYDEAFYWTKLAADKGYADAQYNLGAMYFNGHGVERDEAMARDLYKQACNGGSSFGCDALKTFIVE